MLTGDLPRRAGNLRAKVIAVTLSVSTFSDQASTTFLEREPGAVARGDRRRRTAPPSINFPNMPLYDYRCPECGRMETDVFCKVDDPPPPSTEPCKAPSMCGAPCDLERVVSGRVSWRWKGDYGNEGRGGWTREGEFMSRKVDRKPVRTTPVTRRR